MCIRDRFYGKPLQSVPLRLDVGDIILMSHKDIFKSVVQTVLNSEWDHIAIVVKKRNKTRSQTEILVQQRSAGDTRPVCAEGESCNKTEPDHYMQFRHTGMAKEEIFEDTYNKKKMPKGSPGKRYSRLQLFEATKTGVSVYHLDDRISFIRQSARLGIRRLQLRRTKQMVESLMTCVDEMCGRPYASLGEITKIGEGLENHPHLARFAKFGSHFVRAKKSDVADDGVICSQLIGIAYQQMGIFPPDIDARNLLPSYFAGSDISLSQGKLGELLIIPAKT
eukprot:TRINITY_DN14560_c0_g1_i1.p1 TRINITY_DN14560_c0_g1~~TRINITY_DN14560_c0_g1_i1.p1  ORF type:complete len:279 (-),score=29.42 TRINITY_DN14560_c0_g1_i1:205-1041(-)